jgi:hypothetical protein
MPRLCFQNPSTDRPADHPTIMDSGVQRMARARHRFDQSSEHPGMWPHRRSRASNNPKIRVTDIWGIPPHPSRTNPDSRCGRDPIPRDAGHASPRNRPRFGLTGFASMQSPALRLKHSETSHRTRHRGPGHSNRSIRTSFPKCRLSPYIQWRIPSSLPAQWEQHAPPSRARITIDSRSPCRGERCWGTPGEGEEAWGGRMCEVDDGGARLGSNQNSREELSCH